MCFNAYNVQSVKMKLSDASLLQEVVLLCGLLHLHPPLEFKSHPPLHVGVYEDVHSHPFQLSFPDEHWRTYSFTHLHPYSSAPFGQDGLAVQVPVFGEE